MGRESGKEMAAKVADWVNGADDEEMEQFAVEMVHRTHRTLQQSFFRVVLKCIDLWANALEQGWYDLRNEQTVRTCKKFMDATTVYDRSVPFV